MGTPGTKVLGQHILSKWQRLLQSGNKNWEPRRKTGAWGGACTPGGGPRALSVSLCEELVLWPVVLTWGPALHTA